MRILKQIFFFLLIGLAWLFLLGLGSSDYYERVDRLMGSALTVVLHSNSYPIVSGALDEYLGATAQQKVFFGSGIKLADHKNNYSWGAYQNSRRYSTEYQAKQLQGVINSKVSKEDEAFFVDTISGKSAMLLNKQVLQDRFYEQLYKGEGSMAVYIENIGRPAQGLLEDIFSFELPLLPDSNRSGFEKALPKIDVPNLEQVEKAEKAYPKDFSSQLLPQWQVVLKPLSGRYNQRDESVISLAANNVLRLGVEIINSRGQRVTSPGQMAYVPFITTVPFPTNYSSRLTFQYPYSDINKDQANKTPTGKREGVELLNEQIPSLRQGWGSVELEYSVGADIDLVELNVADSSGKSVFSQRESQPNPNKVLPFVWSLRGASALQAGNYTVQVKGSDNKGLVHLSRPRIVTVETQKSAADYVLNAERLENNGYGDFYSVIDVRANTFDNSGLEKLYVWLHGSENFDVRKPVSSSLYFSFATFDSSKSSFEAARQQCGVGEEVLVSVVLRNQQGLPIEGANVSLISNRNSNERIIDNLSPKNAVTDKSGTASFQFSSRIGGKATLWAISDMVWVKQEPVQIQVGRF